MRMQQGIQGVLDDGSGAGAGVTRVAFFGTHPRQFNGYSKVVYELCKAVVGGEAGRRIKMHVFGFQFFFDHPGHRRDVPIEVDVYDANANENPREQGFGVKLVKDYVERIKPDVCVVFNDMLVLNSVANELFEANALKAPRDRFRIVAYIDQVYLCQHKQFIDNVNRVADAAIAFTPHWKDCIVDQGLTLPTHVLVHGFNPETYFPVPRRLVRRYYNISDEDFLVLNLNRNQPRKRWDTCMQAFAEVVVRRPDTRIKLVVATDMRGAWDLMELLRRELRKRGLPAADVERVAAERVVVPGHPQMLSDEETNVLYNLADIGINTCDGEGFGLCNFEQAAIGIPQIVPKLGGFLHFFSDKTAIMVPPVASIYVDATRDGLGGEAQITRGEDYADAILKYYDSPALRSRHGRAARANILSNFGWDGIARHFAGIVHSVAQLPAKGQPPIPPPPPAPVADPAPAPAPAPAGTPEPPAPAAPAARRSVNVQDLLGMLGSPASHPAPVPAPAPVPVPVPVPEDPLPPSAADPTPTPSPPAVQTDSSLGQAMDEIRMLRSMVDQLMADRRQSG